jgi:hypothetical protein
VSHPRELIFARRVYAWVERLDPEASEEVRLSARSHTLKRWEMPRNRFSMDTGGYHAWRGATANYSAEAASDILRENGYSGSAIQRVSELIRRVVPPQDPDAQLLEDADCLAFLEIKLESYLDQWDQDKLDRILSGTWQKMSPRARRLALDLPIAPDIRSKLEGLG